MNTNKTTVDVLAVLDEHHDTLIAAGDYSGEGCWFRGSEEQELVAEYAKARAAIAGLIERERVMREALRAVKQWNDVSGLDEEWPVVMEQVDAALRACGGA